MSSQAHSAATPQALGRYELLMPVARGGMGQVWAGRLRGARGFNKLVAIKTLLPMPGSEGRLETMLLEEARIAALIHHPNVVQTLELGEHEGTLYLVMEWVDGEPLSFLLDRTADHGGLPLPIAVNLVGQTLLGLEAAHELVDENGTLLGVVHRDVSPHNVLVTYSGVAKLVDFGIAKATNQDSSSTQTGEVKGKFSYMAPEQICGERVDQRADIFALGIMLYTLTTGRHPFKSENPGALLHKIAGDERPLRPSLVVSGYSPALEAVVMKALEKDVSQRWQSAREMLAALQNAVPDAFVADFESNTRTFLSELLGNRPTLRREALRRAQLAADARGPSGNLPALSQIPSQSASSLRALSIDQMASEAPAQASVEAEPSAPRTPRSRAKGRRYWGSLLGVAAAMGIAFVLFRVVARLDHTAHTARRAAVSADGPVVAPHQLGPSTSLPTPSTSAEVPAPSASVAPAPSSKVSGKATAAPKQPVTNSKPRPQRQQNRDLIAPDYAR
ncbi:MAG: protein kinase domain-containing protein [Myxococcota bacterium]